MQNICADAKFLLQNVNIEERRAIKQFKLDTFALPKKQIINKQ